MTEIGQASGPAAGQALLEDPQDFSPVLGGPLYQLYLRTRVARPPLEFLGRRVIVIALIAWLPLLPLSAIDGNLAAGAVRVPFLYDFDVHVRLLVALPMLIIAEKFAHPRVLAAVQQFVDRGIVGAQDMPRFRTAIHSALRARNSRVAEILLLAFVYSVGQWVWRSHISQETSTWYAISHASSLTLTPAGYWYAFAGVTVFQFLLLRWYLRLLIWFWLLWQVSRLDLQLIPTHPDRAGGLAFLGGSAQAFVPILVAQGAVLAGQIANRVLLEGQSLMSFKVVVGGLVAFFVVFLLAPLAMFTPQLTRAKRQGLREYGTFATHYVRQFERKWIREDAPDGELLGAPDLQSLADLGNSYAVIREMRPVPFGAGLMAQMAAATAAPLLPLTLTMFSLQELADRLIKIVF
ncbi:MAG: hypothetical protein EPN75_05745 [Beijerinckiaceae bacterium]|nr:MAG: hypothetical protein EPN75_05745 [Beijerinckiaceae bacterium]